MFVAYCCTLSGHGENIMKNSYYNPVTECFTTLTQIINPLHVTLNTHSSYVYSLHGLHCAAFISLPILECSRAYNVCICHLLCNIKTTKNCSLHCCPFFSKHGKQMNTDKLSGHFCYDALLATIFFTSFHSWQMWRRSKVMPWYFLDCWGSALALPLKTMT